MKCHKSAKVAIQQMIKIPDDISGNNIICDIEYKDDTSGLSKNVGKYLCDICNYNTSKKYNYNKHLSSVKHINHVANMVIICDYNCNACEYHTNKKYNYDKHMMSKKHIEITKNGNEQDVNVDIFKNELIISTIMNQLNTILEENNKNILAEQTKLMVETQTKLIHEMAANKSSSNVNNNNTINNVSNQQFNLNMFLNETCKDAMNLSEFLENMQVSMEDMEKTGELGFAKGMSRIIMNNLNAIDVCKRPIHCSDVKRETLYVKNNGVWEKETEDRKRTKEIIYKASRLNLKELLKWRDLPRNKGYDKSDHTKNDEFTNLVMEINKMREEEFDKIITSVSKHVAIDKEKVKMSGYLN
jgi:hypothetical protein